LGNKKIDGLSYFGMNKMRAIRKCLYILFLLIQACTPSRTYKDEISTWQGVDLKKLLVSWGRPQKIFHRIDGKTVVVYDTMNMAKMKNSYPAIPLKEESGIAINMEKNPSSAKLTVACKTTFTADTNNVIFHWKFAGVNCNEQ
jgi:hypothetical protein